VTVTVWPATVSVPDREDAFVFARMLNCTCALPLPLAALVNEIQETFDVAVHAHVAEDAVTVTAPLVAGAPTDTASEATVNVQGATTGGGWGEAVGGGAAAACEISARCSFTTIPPRRTDSAVFAATEYPTRDPPWPFAEEVSAIQSTSALAVQSHSRLTSTVMFPTPPDAANATTSAASDTEQRDEGEAGFATSVSDEDVQLARRNALDATKQHRTNDCMTPTRNIRASSISSGSAEPQCSLRSVL
jgi:hypothetical protein